ncbi:MULTISPECIES: hypothetical protein [Paenibacillus]|uniref:YozE SAM-like domain-containing protein n=1 Tax=Paenibacillus vini TaxID=1476024 RepID=A0ABQ4MBF3_9BACL|nr:MULTISPECIES: hypothetical protein [Paenibacillus]MBQ4898758.1 hypothetical protein [Paenibacillus sp. Marseille-P2973]MDN4071204.1 hypothetical protein [Paenibacillus vini]GIP53302.1 hypothetical protein J42TS3_23370 [Paenibacillus vini]
MAICVEFELIEIENTIARYRFGDCLGDLNGEFETDLYRFISGEFPGDTSMSEIVVLLNDKQSQWKAIKAFTKIYRHFKVHKEYLSKGGYYA